LNKSEVDELGRSPGAGTRYIINPAAVATAWSGPLWGYRGFRNRSWLNSLWLGTGWHVLCLPQRLWWEIVVPTYTDPAGIAHHVIRFVVLTFGCFFLGIAGWLVMLPFPAEVISRARILDNEEAMQALRSGELSAVRRLR
jgi:hypothetical protein